MKKEDNDLENCLII